MSVCHERVLWLNVILRAQMDARGEMLLQCGGRIRLMKVAREWLTTARPGFLCVCEMAGMERGMVERLVREERNKYANIV